jgi:hypothetical protein
MMTLSLALFFLVTPHAAQAQKDGEAQSVSFDENNWPTLKFSNKRADRQRCGAFLNYVLTGNQEEALVIRASHMHSRRFFQGIISFPEEGWLYITPSRIIFVVEKGDKLHAFDAPRTALKDKPVTKFVRTLAGMQINFKQSPSASDTGDQKFAFLVMGDKKCGVEDPEPYTKLLARAVKDFDGAMAEFKQVAAALKQSGRVEQAPASVTPPGRLAPKVP